MFTTKTFRITGSLLLALSTLAVAQGPDHFNHGLQDGHRGGSYDRGHDHPPFGYDDHRHGGGIGPGQGALIGAGGGAVLGAAFGGGVQGALVGGAVGAGIGALLGDKHQHDHHR